MNDFVRAQLSTLTEGARLLEAHTALDADTRSGLVSMGGPVFNVVLKDAVKVGPRTTGELPLSNALGLVSTMRSAVDALAALSGYVDIPVNQSEIAGAMGTLDDAEKLLAASLRSRLAERLKGIYVIVDPEATRGRPVVEVTAQSLEGGARVVQLRDKMSDKGPALELARELKTICHEHDALFVMNDHADLARASDADVLHVGQTDLPVAVARQILGPHQLIGNSNGSMEEAQRSQADSVDYIAVGAIYSTTTMGKSGRRALSPAMIEQVKDVVSQPIVAIGGINRSNIADVVRAGADSVCVVSAITFAEDPKAATEELVELYESGAG